MMTSSDGGPLVIFRGGFVADLALVKRLWDIEARGCSFHRKDDGGFRVVPSGQLTPDEVDFFRARRDEARRVLAYQADDGHLFTDKSQAQRHRLPDAATQRRSA